MIAEILPMQTEGDLFILAFGAHADDTDIGCSGTLALHAQRGMRAGVCDLTQAELSSNGTVETRLKEAKMAASTLGLSMRLALDFPDRGLSVQGQTVAAVTDLIRRFRPTYVLAPDWEDRHPDHRQCAAIVEEAVFNAALKRLESSSGHAAHRVTKMLYYAINGMTAPDVAVDISPVMEQKQEALHAYGSQFVADVHAVATPLNQGFVEAIVGRDALVGHQVGCRYAEGFRVRRPLRVSDFSAIQ